jgi:hypothetical protein
MAAEIMTPEHPRWSEFAERLGGPEGCNWTDDSWRCGGDHRWSREILGSMTGIDLEASVGYFLEHDGHCDCEVLLNIDVEAPAEAVH